MIQAEVSQAGSINLISSIKKAIFMISFPMFQLVRFKDHSYVCHAPAVVKRYPDKLKSVYLSAPLRSPPLCPAYIWTRFYADIIFMVGGPVAAELASTHRPMPF
jgi:hypothetical protein